MWPAYRYARIWKVVVCLLLYPLFFSWGVAAAFEVSGRSLLLGAEPFQVRGVCYHPRPIGMEAAALPAWGDLFTEEFEALHARDLPLLRELGANVLRVYGWQPGAGHQAFLDACYNGGVNPLFVVVNLWVDGQTDWRDGTAVDALCARFAQVEQLLEGHPAVLALTIGNEVNAAYNTTLGVQNGASPDYWAAMERVIQAIKVANPKRLVSIPCTDALADVGVGATLVPSLDFWSLQVYRGGSFGSLFVDYAAVESRPLLVTEWGMDALDHRTGLEFADNALLVGQTLSQLWSEMAAAKAVCAGGCVFAFGDDWSKVGGASSHDAGGFAHPAFPDGWMDEEWWGLYRSVSTGSGLPDHLEARAAVSLLGALWRSASERDGLTAEGRLINLSCRGRVGEGFDSLVAGFVVEGPGPRRLMVRAVGPTLDGLVPEFLADPRLQVHVIENGVPRLVAENDDWGQAPRVEELARLGAGKTGLPLLSASKDAATVGLFMPGLYTVTVTGGAGGGVALVEVYEIR